jgi:hypothetical protein
MNKEVTQLVRQIRDEIVANYYRMRLNASGRFDRETEVVEYASGVKIESPAYIYQTGGRLVASHPFLPSSSGLKTRTQTPERTYPKKRHTR